MTQISDEIDANRATFFKNWTDTLSKNIGMLEKNPVFFASYRRLTVLQAIKAHIIEQHYSKESAAFYFEAHNDALVSHVAASSGAWRTALQSLRSCVENVLCGIYYNEHAVELELWDSGKFVIGFSDLVKYMEKHPRLNGVADSLRGLGLLKAEYATLSKAVHASAQNFRMTDAISNVLLWSADDTKAGQWATREKRTIRGVCLLLVSMHSALLRGTKLNPVRNVLGFALTPGDKKALRARGINVP